jgi:hypothetical protein
MNVGSDAQKAHLLFAPCERVKKGARGVKHQTYDNVVMLGTPDVYAADATRWPEYRVFKVRCWRLELLCGTVSPHTHRMRV